MMRRFCLAVTLLLAAADIVGTDVTQNLDALHGAVDGHERDAGVDDRLYRRGQRLCILGRDDDAVDSLRDRSLELGQELRRRAAHAPTARSAASTRSRARPDGVSWSTITYCSGCGMRTPSSQRALR